MLQPESGPGCREHSVRLLISAGEASGDMHGAALLGALRQLAMPAPVECFGLGGERLRAAGCETVVDAKDVAVLGLAEVVAHLPRIYREFRRLLAEVDRRRPDAAVLIDFPEFNFRLARQLHRRGIPVIYYISPQLWAWRKGRVKLVRRYVRKMLVIFPFEREFYAGMGSRWSSWGIRWPILRPQAAVVSGAGAGFAGKLPCCPAAAAKRSS